MTYFEESSNKSLPPYGKHEVGREPSLQGKAIQEQTHHIDLIGHDSTGNTSIS